MGSTSTVTAWATADRGLLGLAALPSLRGMTPAEARAAQVLGKPWDPAEIVELAIAWVGAGLDTALLVDLAGRDWDDPDLPVLWDIALDDLGVSRPAPSTARRRIAAYLARRRAMACPRCATAPMVPRPRTAN
ncbi:hypothetical protein [Actinomycetospora cinnamomea]|uniref:Uncharacterized protein n=1 Tax=Actinomycetospora cinnamomea TaxID=663609 RepID=A0A2U1EVI0_9PSEU|nr:hypothetical protein [Actinomycetospora cinnamomea]PVZ03919.1 hypothetical protein C8D89_11928 [Actinomycetospora cinnamomea]